MSVLGAAPMLFPVGSNDPYWSSVVLLCHFEGADASTTFTDQKGHTITAYGNAQIDTAQYKFGSSSGLFDGTGDYLTLADSADWNFASSDFTVEMFVRFPAITGRYGLFGQTVNANNYSEFVVRFDNSTGMRLDVFNGGSSVVSISQGGVTGWAIDTQYHLCWERSGNTWRCYRNGSIVASGSASGAYPDYGAVLAIGVSQQSVNNFYHNGWVDELRVTKGVARYNGSFTPPSAAFPNQ